MTKIYGILDPHASKAQLAAALKAMGDAFKIKGPRQEKVEPGAAIGHLGKPHKGKILICGASPKAPEPSDILTWAKAFGGDFNAVYQDGKTTHIIADRHGLRPIYYHFDGSRLLFASEIKAIIKAPRIEKRINWEFWRDFFAYGFGLAKMTPFEGIERLDNGTILSFDGAVKISRYFDFGSLPMQEGDSEQFVLKGADVLKRAIQEEAQGLAKASVALSGGYDSRCLASGLSRFTRTDIEAYTTVLHPKGHVDIGIAKKIAIALGIKHHEVKGEDLYRRYFIEHVFEVDGLCRDHIWLLPLRDGLPASIPEFDGIGGDTVVKGGCYLKEQRPDLKHLDRYAAEFSREMRIFADRIHNEEPLRYFSKDMRHKVQPSLRVLKDCLAEASSQPNSKMVFYLKNRIANAIVLGPANILRRKVEVRTPFYRNDVVDFFMSLPQDQKYGDEVYARILSDLYPDIMAIPSTNDFTGLRGKAHVLFAKAKAVPLMNRIVMAEARLKRGKRPLKRPEDAAYLVELLSALKVPSFIDADRLKADAQALIKRKRDPGYFLHPLLQFIVWYNLFYLGEDLSSG